MPYRPRCAFVTIGQTPRTDILDEVLLMAQATDLNFDEYGAMNGLDETDIGAQRPREGERGFYTRLAHGGFVSVRASFIEQRLRRLIEMVDRRDYDLIVMLSTGIFETWDTRARLIHSQKLTDLWINALIAGPGPIGIMYHLPTAFDSNLAVNTALVQTTRMVKVAGESPSLDEAARLLRDTDIIVMHSLGYSDAHAAMLAGLVERPVVSVRRLVAGALRTALDELHHDARHPPAGDRQAGPDVLDKLPDSAEPLTPREQDVLRAALTGLSNKEIGRNLAISHRTVEIHRARALAKMQVSSTTELLRRALVKHGG
ncbi:AroM family protein [Nguyenibacter sp. L1]|uniref:AroM family protein n=1 Tax=Nguyenibacter sp. L1 TaxID=3049350 RepID=UPI0038CF304A